jgi:murein DD-endopeptidase MepM/ murein hydrolase activator NlpD
MKISFKMKTVASWLVVWLLIAVLTVTIVIQRIWIVRMTNRLGQIMNLSFDGNAIRVSLAANVPLPSVTLTPSYVRETFRYGSPFGEKRTWRQDLREAVRDRAEDLFGSPRGDESMRRMHEGIDLFMPKGTPVYPLAAIGIVTEVVDNISNAVRVPASNSSGNTFDLVDYGRTLRIRYPEGIESVYAHLNSIVVIPGQIVRRTNIVGTVGDTGNAARSGKPPHLHLELRDSAGKSFDPSERLSFDRSDPAFFLKLLSVTK